MSTGNKLAADTEADVYCVLYGEWGDSGQRRLIKANNHDGKTFRIDQVRDGMFYCFLFVCVVDKSGLNLGAVSLKHVGGKLAPELAYFVQKKELLILSETTP